MTRTTIVAIFFAVSLSANYSSTVSAQAVSDSELEAFLGIAEGALDDLSLNQTIVGGDVTSGSAFQRSLTLAEGDSITVSYNFLTDEGPLDEEIFPDDEVPEEEFPIDECEFECDEEFFTDFNDFAFISIQVEGVLDVLADVNSSELFPDGTLGFFLETGVQTFEYTFDSAGEVTIGLGVVDVGDEVVDSALLVDEILLNGSPLPGGFDDGSLDAFETIGDVQIFSSLDDPILTPGDDIVPALVAPTVGGTYQIIATTVPEPTTLGLSLVVAISLASLRKFGR